MNYNLVLKRLLILVTSFLIWILMSPLVVVILILFTCLFFWRKLIDLIVSLKHPEWKPIEPADSMYGPLLTMYQDRSVGNFASVHNYGINLNGKISVEEIQQAIKSRLLDAPGDIFWKLKYVPEKYLGFYYWTPANLHKSGILAKYISRVTSSTEPDFVDFVANRWICSSFKDRSPWEILIWESPLETKISLRINHLIGGGYSIREIVKALSGNPLTYEAQVVVNPVASSKIFWVYDIIALPWTIFQLLIKSFKSDPLAISSPCTEQIIATHQIELDNVKKIARHFKYPFRTVLASAFGSAIGKFELDTPNRTAKNLGQTQLLVNLPWPYSIISSKKPLNNKAAATIITFPTGCPDAVNRLRTTHLRIQRNHENGVVKFGYYFRYVFYVLPSFVSRKLFLTAPPISNALTDFPWSTSEDVSFVNYSSKDNYGIIGLYGTKIGCIGLFQTTGKTVHMTMQGDKRRVSTPECAKKICKYFQDELEILLEFIKSSSSDPSEC